MPRKKVQPAPVTSTQSTNQPTNQVRPKITVLGHTVSPRGDTVVATDQGIYKVEPDGNGKATVTDWETGHVVEPEQPPVRRGPGRPRKQPVVVQPVVVEDLPDDEDALMALLEEETLEDQLRQLNEEMDEPDYSKLNDLEYGDEIQDDEPNDQQDAVVEKISSLNEEILEGIHQIRLNALASKAIVDKWGPEWKELADEFGKMANAFPSVG